MELVLLGYVRIGQLFTTGSPLHVDDFLLEHWFATLLFEADIRPPLWLEIEARHLHVYVETEPPNDTPRQSGDADSWHDEPLQTSL